MLLTNATVATLKNNDSFGLITDGAIALAGDTIAWVGKADDVPAQHHDADVRDLNGRLVTPALIDCHTHVVFGGNRASEFEQRLEGVSYADIAAQGGGSGELLLQIGTVGDDDDLEAAQLGQ